MKKFNILNDYPSKENKFDFSIEVSLVCIFFGSIFASLISTILIFLDGDMNFTFLEDALRIALGFFLLFLVIIIGVFIPFMGLAVILRVTISFLIKIKADSKSKLAIILTIGIGYIILISYLLSPAADLILSGTSSLLIIPYIITFCLYTLYRNIWNPRITKIS